MERVYLIEQKELLLSNEKLNSNKNIALMLTYNRAFQNRSEIVIKIWYLRQINPEFCNVFVNKLTIKFKRNKNLQDLFGGHLIKDKEVAKKKLEKRKVKARHVIAALYCTQAYQLYLVWLLYFKSNQTKRAFF